ncbi:MAG: recombinase family protein [Candidatus Pacebacteria bacterium]|nr:recombinase family protein [Candidatus Paceibacterota bacterium]
MLRAVIYARYSTDLQNERSIGDQIELCKAHCQKKNFHVVDTYDDQARSGASIIGRSGLLALMDGAKRKKFDVVVVEALDRLSRDMEDLAGIHKRLTFGGTVIEAVNEGPVNTVLVGLRGLIGQLYREDNAHKIRRGLSGRVRDGLSAGGAPYGYRADPAAKGKLIIIEEEAVVIRRIFDEFVKGRSPRAIAHGLNQDEISPPRGRKWNASTINGSKQRGNGIIRNALYAGKLVWNKVSMVKDPDTGRRLSRPNAPDQWQSAEVAQVRIVEAEVFEAAKNRKRKAEGIRPFLQKRPRRLLSGLLRCGSCGAGMSTNGKDPTGRVRVRCSAATESGICPDPKTFYLDKIEDLVLRTLSAELRHPAAITEYVRTYHEERKRLVAAAGALRGTLERKLQEVRREMDRLIDAVAKGILTPELVRSKIKDADREREQILEKLSQVDTVENVVVLHPTALARYERQLCDLHAAFNAGLGAGDNAGCEALRDLIDKVTIYRKNDRAGRVRIEIAGKLNALLGADPHPRGLWGVVVAEEGLEPPTQGL